ncbi:hypothetical protein YT1_1609 [Rhodococcus ruber]|nr:hypothetical protein YT1_1609 [Rhodococcus ruber]
MGGSPPADRPSGIFTIRKLPSDRAQFDRGVVLLDGCSFHRVEMFRAEGRYRLRYRTRPTD